MKDILLNVKGMSCEGCENRIKNAVGTIEGVEKVTANHKDGTVSIIAKENVTEESIKEKIDDIGFEVIK